MSREGWRTKTGREIAKRVRAAGGEITLTRGGHLKVTGPQGTAIVSSAPPVSRAGGRALANTWRTIERYTGLKMTGEGG